jgi:hypothetical protein
MALFFAVAAHVLPTKPLSIVGNPLAPVNPLEPEISGSGFAPDAVFENVPPHITGIQLYGSAVAGDASIGLVRTRWYRAFPHFYLLLSGYPVNYGCEVYLEVLKPQAAIQKVPISFDENPQHWRLQRISLAAYPTATQVRIVASDNSTTARGWLGFSPPFTIPKQQDSENAVQLARQVMLIIACMAACLVAALGPGILTRALISRSISPVWFPLPGILIVAATGLLVWFGPRDWPPATISRIALSLLFLFIGALLVRWPLTSLLSPEELKVLGVITLLAVIAVAKSSYSIGPSGELYRGTVSHSLEGGGRSDSRISYHIVHLIAERRSPYGEAEAVYFAPWTFSHRGPLAALFAAPFVLCTRLTGFANPAVDVTWTLFDPQGFTAYRIAMMALAACSLFIVFGLARLWLDTNWALLAFLVVAGAPFTLHEIFFTWPKLLAGSLVLLACYSFIRRRSFPSGLALGLGYLSHPSVLLCVPGMLGISMASLKILYAWRGALSHCRRALTFGAGLSVVLLAWRLINGNHFHQDGFFSYFHDAIPFPFTPINWVHSRLINLSMTLMPMGAFSYRETNPEIMAYGGLSHPWAQFIHQYWSTLPFGVGVFFYPVLIWLVAVGFARQRAWAWLVILPPFALFLIYWGPGNSGLLREGLHGWVLGLLVFAIVMWKTYLANSRVLWRLATVTLVLRGIETVLMLVPFSAWSRGYILQRPFAVSDFCMLAIMIFGTATLTFLVWSQCNRVAPQPLTVR